MCRLLLTALVFLSAVMVAIPAPKAEPAVADPLVEQVRKAIDRGVRYLRARKTDLVTKDHTHWENNQGPSANYQGGMTSLALLALLNSGVPASDPDIQRGLNYLRTIPPSRTYVVALETMVYAQAGQAVDRERIQANVDWLVAARGEYGWSYGKIEGGGGDNSNTQYALLGLHEGLVAGAKINPKVIQKLRDFYIKTQINGGWSYRPPTPQTPGQRPIMTMTTAGVCGLMITGMDLALGKQVLRDDGSAENCGVYDENKPLADGRAWIGARFPARLTVDTIACFDKAPFYGLYGIERTGRFSGQRYLGGHDWYRLGSEYLVSIQKPEGNWEGHLGNLSEESVPIVATSFALLFLSKGRTPILITKLAHGQEDGWNNKRSDCRYLVEFASRELFKKQPMGWQVFDVRKKEAEDVEALRQLASELLPSPIVYLNGHSLRLSDKEKAILTEYINNGGFLFAEACCGSTDFDRDFRALMQEIFPSDGPPRLVRVPPDHPVWYASGKFVVKPDDPVVTGGRPDGGLWGVQQGCKWVALYSPRPLAGYWEANQHNAGKGKTAFQLGANIIAYATGLEPPRPRLTEMAVVRDDVPAPRAKRNYLEVGQLIAEGESKPPARAMRFLMEECRKSGLDVLLSTAQVALSPNVQPVHEVNSPVRKIEDVRFFYLHGRREFSVGAREMEELRLNLESGGTLFADACCGARTFDESFRKFVEQMWEKKGLKLKPIPLNDPLFNQELTGGKIEQVRCRRRSPDGNRVKPEYQNVAPELLGIEYNGRWLVIYSPYDIGCALEKHASSDCLGHDYASAVLLGKAAVMYALTH